MEPGTSPFACRRRCEWTVFNVPTTPADIPRYLGLLRLAAGRCCADDPDLRLLPPVEDGLVPADTGSDAAKAIDVVPPEAASADTLDEVDGFSVFDDEGPWYGWMLPPVWHVPKGWESGFELGIDGSEGNSTTLSFRTGANFKRKVDWSDLKISLTYVKATAEYVETKHNAQMEANHDWLFKDSPWSLFGKMILVYDEFRPFDLELTLNSGLGYRFIDTDATTLKGRVGSGATRQFGGVDNNWRPEALLGMDFDHKLSDRQKVRMKVEYFPEWGDFDHYRIRTDAGWEVLLDESMNMSLKLGVIDRYDSEDGGQKPNALDYSLLLLWSL